MKEGILFPDLQTGRIDIRFHSDDFYGGLHCGTTMDALVDDRWITTRIEFGSNGWYLVGIETESILGMRVRIR